MTSRATLALFMTALLLAPGAGAQNQYAQTQAPSSPQSRHVQTPTAPAAQPSAPRTSPVTPTATTRITADVFDKTRPATFRLDTNDGLGTGFFISQDGLALTAYHVVFGAKTLSARLLDGKDYPVNIIGYDDANDVALVKVNVNGPVPFLPLAQTAPQVGEAALAIGNSGGGFLRPKYGNLKRLDVASTRADFPSGTLELDAQLRPGDSGGPIINAKGEAFGVVSYIIVSSGPNGVTSHAVPMTTQSALLSALQRGEKRDAPVLGLRRGSDDLSSALDYFDRFSDVGLGPKPGVTFELVQPNSPAALAGLKPLEVLKSGSSTTPPTLSGDVILSIDGQPVRTWNDLVARVRGKQVGDSVRLLVQRGDATREVTVTLAARAAVYGNAP